MYRFYDGNGRTCRILFDNKNDDKNNPYCVKYSRVTKNRNIKIEHKVDRKINLHVRCIDCGFQMF